MSATNQNLDYSRCKPKDHCRSIDALSQIGAVTVLLSLLPKDAPNTSVVPNSNQITVRLPFLQDQELMTLLGRPFSESGSERAAVAFLYKSC